MRSARRESSTEPTLLRTSTWTRAPVRRSYARVCGTEVVPVDIHAAVDVHAGFLPLADDESLLHERAQSKLVEPLEALTPAGDVPLHRAIVELLDELMAGLVELREGEEGPVAQPREDPPLHDLHCAVGLRPVLRVRGADGQHRGLAVGREFLVRPPDRRLVAPTHTTPI